MVVEANGNGSAALGGKTEKDLRVELAAAYNILDYLNLGEGILIQQSADIPLMTRRTVQASRQYIQ